MNNRLAIIDLGTNTFHLLIAELRQKKVSLLHQETIPVSLGEGGMEDGQIKDSAFERGLKALKWFKKQIELHQVTKVKALATSALRSASNGAKFIDQVIHDIGIQIDLIDGNREAELIYSAVRAAINLGRQNCLIMDIGGGSVEFVICNEEQLFWKKSYDIGAARLMNQFHHSDPISKSDIENIYSHLNIVLVELAEQIKQFMPFQLIGSAGAFETYAALIDTEFKPSFENPEFIIDIQEFEKIKQMIINSNHEERAKNPIIPEIRVDMIVVASILTDYVLKLNYFREIKLSSYSLKEGVLFEMIN